MSDCVMQSYPARALVRRLQVDWARDPRRYCYCLILILCFLYLMFFANYKLFLKYTGQDLHLLFQDGFNNLQDLEGSLVSFPTKPLQALKYGYFFHSFFSTYFLFWSVSIVYGLWYHYVSNYVEAYISSWLTVGCIVSNRVAYFILFSYYL